MNVILLLRKGPVPLADRAFTQKARDSPGRLRAAEYVGKSGLQIKGRDALKQLIETVTTGKADFEAFLVYDVSRWGRFQDADESAYYEYISRRITLP